jgi:polysaccharide pyruvyl transferase WcaK-like protein
MAASEGSRCSALSYDPKVSRLMAEAKMSGWELTDLPNDPVLISQTWEKIYSQKVPLSDSQRQAIITRTLDHKAVLEKVCAA